MFHFISNVHYFVNVLQQNLSEVGQKPQKWFPDSIQEKASLRLLQTTELKQKSTAGGGITRAGG
jgi:hypothetical protein